MGPYLQYAAEKKADTIELRVYPGANGSFTLYEDEGDNYNYETGKYATIPITYLDNPKNVVIGARSGSFTGMDVKKVFNVVYVSANHGTAEGITAQPDCQLVYSGAQVSCTPVAVLPTQGAAAVATPANFSMKTAGNNVVLPNGFIGKMKHISVFDCSGKMLYRAATKKNSVDIRKDFGFSAGVYIVNARVIR